MINSRIALDNTPSNEGVLRFLGYTFDKTRESTGIGCLMVNPEELNFVLWDISDPKIRSISIRDITNSSEIHILATLVEFADTKSLGFYEMLSDDFKGRGFRKGHIYRELCFSSSICPEYYRRSTMTEIIDYIAHGGYEN